MMPLQPPGQQAELWPQADGQTRPDASPIDPGLQAQNPPQIQQEAKVVKKLEVCVLCSQHNPVGVLSSFVYSFCL